MKGVILAGGAPGGALADGGSGPARQVDAGGVEVAAAGHGAVDADCLASRPVRLH